MLDRLRCCDESCIENGLVLDFARDLIGFLNDAVDWWTVHALRFQAGKLGHLLHAVRAGLFGPENLYFPVCTLVAQRNNLITSCRCSRQSRRWHITANDQFSSENHSCKLEAIHTRGGLRTLNHVIRFSGCRAASASFSHSAAISR